MNLHPSAHRWRVSTSLSTPFLISPLKISAESVSIPLTRGLLQQTSTFLRMKDLNEKWRIQEFDCIEKHNSKLNSSWNAASGGILACAVVLNLPILLILSVLGFVFLFPFGFVFLVYSAVYELHSVLLDEKRSLFQFHSEYQNLCSYDLGKDEGYELESGNEASKEFKEVNQDGNETDENVGSFIRMTSPFLSWEGSEDFGDLEQLLGPRSEEETKTELQEDCDVKEGNFGQIEPQEFVRETMEMCEAVRNEGEAGIESVKESIEESSSIKGTVLDLERVKLLFVEEDRIDGVSRLQTINEQLENGKPKKMKKDDALGSMELEIERITSAKLKLSPHNVEKMNTVRDVWNATYKSMYHE